MLNRLGGMKKASKGVKKVKRSKGRKRRERGIALGFTKRATQKVPWIF